MISTETLHLLNKTLEIADSFQQDYGKLRYSTRIESYADNHRITVTIQDGWKIIHFAVDKTDEDFLYQRFELKTKELIDESRKEIKNK